MSTILKKNTEGYGYKYTDIAEIHKYLEENGMKYYQEITTSEINGKDYIMTYRYINGEYQKEFDGYDVWNLGNNSDNIPQHERE